MKTQKAEAIIYVLMLFTEQDVVSVACSSISEVVDVLYDDFLNCFDLDCEHDDILPKSKSVVRKFVVEKMNYGHNLDYNNLNVHNSNWLTNYLFQIDSHRVKLEVKLARR